MEILSYFNIFSYSAVIEEAKGLQTVTISDRDGEGAQHSKNATDYINNAPDEILEIIFRLAIGRSSSDIEIIPRLEPSWRSVSFSDVREKVSADNAAAQRCARSLVLVSRRFRRINTPHLYERICVSDSRPLADRFRREG